jgi:hypothetical protein
VNLEVFCYLGLLRFPEQLEPSLALLPDGEREQALKILAELKSLAKSQLLQRWMKLREDEYVSMRRDLYRRVGLNLAELPPSLQPWCISWLADQNG